MNGWVRIHRRLRNKGFYQKSQYVHLWLHILLCVNHTEKEFLWNGNTIKVQPGQFVSGRKQLSEDTGIPETTVERILSFFEKDRQIGQQKTSKYRLITVYKWYEYQISDNKWTTSGQQADTNNNDKKGKNILGGSEEPQKENLMSLGNKRYKGEDHGYEDAAIDLDTREVVNAPAPKKPAKKVPDDIQQVFDLFSNPARVTWRLRELERVAAQALFDTYGLETLKKRLQRIENEKNNKDPLFPLVTTPSQLLDKMPNVERYFGI